MTDQRNSIYEKLRQLGDSDFYPYHMPGHKRQQVGCFPEQILKLDITEIDDFDNLHQPEGIIKEAQERANALYGADQTYYMVNGSSGGILSAISAALPQGGHLLMDRGCHKSVYHGVYLRDLQVSYLCPPRVEGFEFSEAVTPRLVEDALIKEPDIQAVLIVSPTYEGRIADVKSIAAIVHRRGIPLIVDEAHGAHLGFHEQFAESSSRAGADLVIHSTHKTLPAMTQTAMLHLNGHLVDARRLERFLHIYQTSSPSYVLMASMEAAMTLLEKERAVLFSDFYNRYHDLFQKLAVCRRLRFVSWSDVKQKRQDVGKLVIDAGNSGVSGRWLYQKLREKYHLQCEMVAGSYCLAMFTLADPQEAYDRMAEALLQIDRELCALLEGGMVTSFDEKGKFRTLQPELPKVRLRYTQAWDLPFTAKKLQDAEGCTVAEFINLYPPGVPILVPGEVMDENAIDKLLILLDQKYEVQGIFFKENVPYLNIVE